MNNVVKYEVIRRGLVNVTREVHSVHPLLSPPLSDGEVEPPTNFLKKEGLTGSQFLEGGAGKDRVTFIEGACNFYTKHKLKSQIFNNKKSFISENVFLCHN